MNRKLAPMEQQMKKLEPVTEQLANLNSRLSGLEANLQDQADRAVFEGMAEMAILETLNTIQAKLGQLEQSVGTVQSKIIDLEMAQGDDDMTGPDKIAEHDHELCNLTNKYDDLKAEMEQLRSGNASGVTQHRSIDLSKARKMKDTLAVRDKLNFLVFKDPAGMTPEQVVDEILGDGVRAKSWEGMTVQNDFVAAGDKRKIKLQFPSKETRNAFKEKYFPADATKKRSTKLGFKGGRVWFSCPQPEWQAELFDPLWKLKDVLEARGYKSAQPLKLFVEYRTECLVDAMDSKKVYAKIVDGRVEPTSFGKAC